MTDVSKDPCCFSIVFDIFKGTDSIVEIMTHKGYLDFNILITEKFKTLIKNECEKQLESLKDKFTP